MAKVTETSTDYVFDTFAVMCYVYREPGWERVVEILTLANAAKCGVALCMVNWTEALYMLMRRYGRDADTQFIDGLDTLPIRLVPVDRELCVRVARLKWPGGLSLGDCYAAALAQMLDATLVTGDPELKRVADVVDIEWLPTATA